MAQRTKSTAAKFFVVSLISLGLNSLWVALITGPLGLGPAWPLLPMLFVTPAVTFILNRQWVLFRLMERIVYDHMAALDQRHWWYRARREMLATLIRRRALPPKARDCSRSAAAPATICAMLGEFGQVDALEIDDAARAFAEQRLGPAGHGRAAARARRRPRAALRPDRRVRRHRAYRRRPGRAGVDRRAS